MSDRIDIVATLEFLRPGEEWILDGDDYSGLTWLSNTPKPEQTEIISAWPLVQSAKQEKADADAAARKAAIDHAKSLGFTDAMIAVMYPNLGIGDESE